MELQFATNQELIDELMNRSTFVGVLIHSGDEHKSPEQVHSNFRTVMRTSPEQTIQLLDHIAAHLESGEQQ